MGEMRKTGNRLGWCLVGWGVWGGGWVVGVDEVAAQSGTVGVALDGVEWVGLSGVGVCGVCEVV